MTSALQSLSLRVIALGIAGGFAQIACTNCDDPANVAECNDSVLWSVATDEAAGSGDDIADDAEGQGGRATQSSKDGG